MFKDEPRCRRVFPVLLILICVVASLTMLWRWNEAKFPCFQILHTQYGAEVCTQAVNHRSPHISDDTIWDRGDDEECDYPELRLQ